MLNPLTKLLETRDWLLADGATGTNLFNLGLEAGEAPEMWNIDKPENIRTLYKEAVDAGSDLFLTNTFGGNASRLKLHNAINQVHELNRIGAAIGRDIADSSGRTVIVAGAVGPTGDIMAPMGKLTHEIAVEMFHEQAEGLKAGGADVLWVETISAQEEFCAAAEAFALAGMDWCGTMSFDTAGRTMMGLTSADMVEMVKKLNHQPIGYGANCGVGAADLLRTILGIAEHAGNATLISKGNAGIPKYHDGHIYYDGTPALMSNYALLARNCGARIIGGCCGTTPKHLVAMRTALEETPKGSKPNAAQIVEALGDFSSLSDGTDGRGPVRAPRRGRRKKK